MLIREISLSNVGLYRGDQVVRPSTDPDRPVTLIGGRNGTGKTTLLDAIPLCLYGTRARGIVGASSYTRHLAGLVHHGQEAATVGLAFDRREDGHDVQYLVERSWSITDGGNVRDQLAVMVDGSSRPDLERNWAEYVERIMPLSVSGLNIFDGEKIEALADVSGAPDVLRAALFGLLGLDLVDRLQDDLTKFRRSRARNSASPSDLKAHLEERESELTDAERDLFNAKADVEQRAAELDRAHKTLNRARDRLSKSGGDLFRERDRLKADEQELIEERSSLRAQLERLAYDDLPLLMVPGLIAHVSEVGETSRQAREAALVLGHLKERDRRIVRQLEDEHDLPADAIRVLGALLDDDRQTYEQEHAVAFQTSDAATTAATALTDGAMADIRNETRELLAAVARLDHELASVRRSLDQVPEEDEVGDLIRAVAAAEVRAENAAARLDEAHAARAAAEAEVARRHDDVEDAAARIVAAGAARADEERIARETAAARDTLDRFKRRVVARNLDSIRGNMLDAFRRLTTKDGLINDILIDPDTLAIGLVNGNGDTVDPDRLSAGERQTLATAMLWGLSRSTGRTLPTIIDTPVGRLDSSHRRKLTERYFPYASRQVILLSTDEELVGDYRRVLLPHVGAEYLLDYDPDTDATSVTEGYFE